jgi:hypothetical protein
VAPALAGRVTRCERLRRIYLEQASQRVSDNETKIEVKRSDLIFLYRVCDTAFSELEAAVADGLVDESVLIEMDESIKTIKGYLS